MLPRNPTRNDNKDLRINYCAICTANLHMESHPGRAVGRLAFIVRYVPRCRLAVILCLKVVLLSFLDAQGLHCLEKIQETISPQLKSSQDSTS